MYQGTGLSGAGGVFGGLGATVGVGPMWQWMGRPGDANLIRYQRAVNKELVARGFKAIGTDGQFGPATCGAISWLATVDPDFDANPDLGLVTLMVSPDGVNAGQMNPCKSATYPTKVGGGVYKPPSTFSEQLPWCAPDNRVLQVQVDLNNDLSAHGYDIAPTDGKMCAETCGAMKLAADLWGVDYLSAYGKNCQSFTAPSKKVVAAPPSSPSPVVSTGPSPTTSILPIKKKSTSQAWMVGGLIGAAALAGLYAASKHKK